jgi:cytochrome P450
MDARSAASVPRERWAKRWGGCRATQVPPGAPLPRTLQTLAFWRFPHAYLAWCSKRYGHTFTMTALRLPPLVFFSRPQDIRQIVRAPANVLHPGAGGAAVITPLVGEGSFMLADDDDHLRGRRAVLPALRRRRVQRDSDAVAAIVEREIATWPVDTPVALYPYLRALLLRLAITRIFGQDATAQGELYEQLLAMMSVNASLALQEPQLTPFPPWRAAWNRFLASRAVVDELLFALIERRAHAARSPPGLLSALVQAASEDGRPNLRQVRDDVMSLLLAGHETTASELAWAFQLLVHHPDVMARARVDSNHHGP